MPIDTDLISEVAPGVFLRPLSKTGKLDAGTNVIEFLPPKEHHWVLYQLIASYNAPVIAGGSVVASYLRNPFDAERSMTFARHATDLFNGFPLIGGSWSVVTGEHIFGQTRPVYLTAQDKMQIAFTGAPAERPYQIRGLYFEAHASVNLSCFM